MALDPMSPRFARQRVLAGFGPEAQTALAGAHVLVIGAGGLGSAILPLLAAAGVGTLTVLDDDTVAESNLHRQTLHTAGDVGTNKALSAAASVRAVSPDADIRALEQRFAAGTTFDLLLDVDVLVDASDNPATRYLANDAATIRGIPLVWGSALGYAGQVGVAVAGGREQRRRAGLGPPDPVDGGDRGQRPPLLERRGFGGGIIKLYRPIHRPMIGKR